MKSKNMKRILEVKIRRMIDDSPDTSWLGEYANSPTSEFSIDRAHSEDCQSVEVNHKAAVDKLERIKSHINDWYNDNLGKFNGALGDSPAHRDAEDLDDAENIILEAIDDCTECDCGGHQVSSREYRYFNPSFNYVGKDGKPTDGLTPEDVRKYTRQDYERMETLNRGDWCFLGIRAEAEVIGNVQNADTPKWHGVVQKVSSGGLWGIESDSDRPYLESVEKDEIANLRTELKALGFSSRAISTAFKNVEEVSQ